MPSTHYSNSTVTSHSISVFTGDSLKIPEVFQTLKQRSRPNSKLYIEVHPKSISDFVQYLNLPHINFGKDFWAPCIVFLYPEELDTPKEVDHLLARMSAQISRKNFSLTEMWIGFYLRGNVSPFNKILCDPFNYTGNSSETTKFCHKYSSRYLSEEFFMYNPVSARRRDFNGATLNVIAQYDPAYEERLSIKEYENGTVEYTNGMCLDILLALQISMNFTYVPKKGNGWAGRFPNGTSTGMSAQLIQGQADFSIAQASFILMMDQTDGISFLQASAQGDFVALFRQPHSSVKLLTVMTRKGWTLALVTWAIVLFSVYIAEWVLKKVENSCASDKEFVHEAVLWALTTACQKGYHVKPTSQSLRIICVVASFFAMCIYVACSAKLTGNLVSPTIPIKSFKDLTRSKLEVYADKWLPIATGLIEKIYNQRNTIIPVENGELYTITDGLPMVLSGKQTQTSVAFVTFSDAVTTVFKTLNKSDFFFCETVSTVEVAAAKTPAGMFVKKGSHLKEILNYNILMLSESGILHRLNGQYEDKTQIKCKQPTSFYRGGLFMKDLQTSFHILVGGGFIAVTTLISEKFLSLLVSHGSWLRRFDVNQSENLES